MRKGILFCLIILNCFLFSNAQKTALSTIVSLSVENESIYTILKKIENQTNVRFMYNPHVFKNIPPIYYTYSDVSIRKVLKDVINDKDILFYELNNYVIISLRNEIPEGTIFERSISEQSESITPIKSINDTLRVFDTLSFVVFDTILIKVYDTIHVQSKYYKENKVEKHIKKISFISAQVSPLYQITLNNSDIGNISFLAQVNIGKQKSNFTYSIGAGYFLQRGRQKHTKNNDYLDSTFHSSVENKIHKFVIADYYYINSLGDTVHNIIYDSVAISVPYSWYSYSKRTTYSQILEEYSISWLTLPIRFGYLGMNNRIVNLGFLCEITPSIAINSSGKIYLSSSNNILENDIKFITSYNLFMSCSPIIQIGKPKERLIFTITPKVQYSFLSTYINEKYKSLSIGIGLGVQYYL